MRYVGGDIYLSANLATIIIYELVVEPTHLKNISQIGSFPQVGVKIKKILKSPPSYRINTQEFMFK